MKLLEYFDEFLKETVNLDPARLARLDKSSESISDFLEGSATFSSNFIDVVAQGSYAHKTIIKPVKADDEFDADILLCLEEFNDWQPKDYVEELYKCFTTTGIYKSKAVQGKRCVTIDYAGDFHVDVVPYIERDPYKYITNRTKNQLEVTNPQGYNAWLDEKSKTTSRRLTKVIRLVKYIRDYRDTFDVKSFVLNVLLAERVNDAALLQDPNCYSDVPTTLYTVAKRLREFLEPRPLLPTIMDPSGTGENLSDRWSQTGYDGFRAALIRNAKWIEEAYTDGEVASSLTKWQKIFGADFKKPEAAQTKALFAAGTNLPIRFDNTEQMLSRDLRIPLSLDLRYRVRLDGRVARAGSFGAFYLRDRGNKVRRGREILFEIRECSVPEPYTIYWKVLNRGEKAQELNCIRGQIELGGKQWKRLEPTSFRGPHFVEVYIVKNGVCVAKDRQEVNIL